MKTTQQMNEFTGKPVTDPERQRQVSEWLNELHTAVKISDDTCYQVWERLYPVMRREPTEDCKMVCGNQPIELVEIAESIRLAVQVVNSITEKHCEMLRLLEI